MSTCDFCDGGQYIRYNVPFGDLRFGKIFPCPKCNREGIIRASGLNPAERLISLDTIRTNARPGAAQMVKAAREFERGGFTGFLSIYGGFGNGKTTTLKAIVNACIAAGIEARYMTMTEVMVYAREAFDSQQAGDTDYGRIGRLATTRVLCIDELDKARVTDYAREVQTHLFDVRYRRAAELGTVVVWNGGINTVKDVLPWVVSRLSEHPMIENADKDYRPVVKEMK
jgi:DNA replication protein DnaC